MKVFRGKQETWQAASTQLIAVEPVLLVTATLAAIVAIGSTGSLYGVLEVGMGVRDTILPTLLFPILTPALMAATRAFTAAGALAYAVALEDA